jgi:DNA-binding NtrC family response regulator
MTADPPPRPRTEPAHSDLPDRPEGGAAQQTQLLRLLQPLTARLGETPLKLLVSETVVVIERHFIEAALASTEGNRSAAAKMLGLSRQSLYVKLARYGIGAD